MFLGVVVCLYVAYVIGDYVYKINKSEKRGIDLIKTDMYVTVEIVAKHPNGEDYKSSKDCKVLQYNQLAELITVEWFDNRPKVYHINDIKGIHLRKA